MKKLLWALLLIGCMIFQTRIAEGHVFIKDNGNQIGAVLHVFPDDDPVAGELASLFYDIQGQIYQEPEYTATLLITDAEGKAMNVPITKFESTLSADYTFPSRGVFNLKLEVRSINSAYTFEYFQRVSRGVSASSKSAKNYPWAEAALVGSTLGVAVLLILAFNNRKKIRTESKF